MIHKLPITDLEIMLENSFNYESIRLEAVKIFQSINPNVLGISEKGKIIYNPFRIYMFDTSNEVGAETLFDIEVLDDKVDTESFKLYKRCFVKAFDNLLRQNRLIPAKHILQDYDNRFF
ncbi:hypothetical protein JSO54_03695 [Riemerella anatipestifer]|uniref:hypothetical protein n=1 Tax=Riemerella anatipestifer TaxID=34085 RepID=UPI0030C0947D